MTDSKTTETPWKGPAIIGLQKDATPFSFEQTETQEHTLVMGPARMGRDCPQIHRRAPRTGRRDRQESGGGRSLGGACGIVVSRKQHCRTQHSICPPHGAGSYEPYSQADRR